MRSIVKKKVSILAILGSFILSTGIFYNSLVFHASDNNLYAVVHDIPLETSKISGTIHINNNWTDAKNAGICNGSGTWSDPYTIKDLIIDGGNSSNCIKIQNSSVYFRIENCTLFNAGTYWSHDYAGILLEHTNNGMIFQNNCSKNKYGIHFDSYSNNNTVYRNYVNDNFHRGISLDTFCCNNTIIENNFNNNTKNGIRVRWNSHNNTISKNNVSNNVIGVVISYFSEMNNVVDNNISYNRFPNWGPSASGDTYGIRIVRAENNYIIRNLVTFNADGISVDDSNYNSFLNNSIISNGFFGIRLLRSDENKLLRNTISFNDQIGIKIEESESNIVRFNEISNHIVGIHLDIQSKCNVIVNNSFSGNIADIADYQKPCEPNGVTLPPIDVIFISLAIGGILLLIIGVILVSRNLQRIKLTKSRKQTKTKEE